LVLVECIGAAIVEVVAVKEKVLRLLAASVARHAIGIGMEASGVSLKSLAVVRRFARNSNILPPGSAPLEAVTPTLSVRRSRKVDLCGRSSVVVRFVGGWVEWYQALHRRSRGRQRKVLRLLAASVARTR